MDRAMPGAEPVRTAGFECPGEIGDGLLNRRRQRQPCGEMCGNGRGQGAAGAVGIIRVNALMRVGRDRCGRVIEKDVGQFFPEEMARFGQNRQLITVAEFPGGLVKFIVGTDRPPEDDLQFGNIRGDQRGQREQQLLHGRDGIIPDQAIAAGGDHDRIENDSGDSVFGEQTGDAVDDLGCVQHADLDGISADIIEDCTDLLLKKGNRHRMDCSDPEGVLGSQSGYGTRAVAAAGPDSLEICLDTGATAGIGTGDG